MSTRKNPLCNFKMQSESGKIYKCINLHLQEGRCSKHLGLFCDECGELANIQLADGSLRCGQFRNTMLKRRKKHE